MDEPSGGRLERPEACALVELTPAGWSDLARCRALARLQRWTDTPAMEEMSLYD